MRSLQNVVEEIWLDKSGSEVRMVYRNRSYRRFRGAQTEEKILNSALISPAGKSEAMAGNYYFKIFYFVSFKIKAINFLKCLPLTKKK
jgi:hypothetical protein